MRRPHAHAVADLRAQRAAGRLGIGREGHVLVGAEPHLRALDGRVAVIHAERLEARVAHRPAGRHRDDRAPDREGGPEREAQLRVGGVHQRVGAGLDLGGPVVQVVRAGAAGRHHRAAHLRVRGGELRHRDLDRGLPRGALRDRHRVSLVAHHAPHLEPAPAGEVGEAARVLGRAAAARQAHVHVDQDLAHAPRRGGLDRLGRVDGHRDARVEPAEPARVERLVGEQQVLAQARGRHALHLAHRRAAEGAVAELGLAARERRALRGLHVRTQARARARAGHRGEVVLERRHVDHERGRRKVVELHGWPAGYQARRTTLSAAAKPLADTPTRSGPKMRRKVSIASSA